MTTADGTPTSSGADDGSDGAITVSAEYTLEKRDFVDMFNAGPAGRKARWLALWLGIVAVGQGAMGLATVDWWRFGVAAVLALLAFAIVSAPRLSWRQALRNFEPGELDIQFSMDREGYRMRSAKGDMSGNWAGVHRVRETPRGFLIFPSEAIFYFIPKRVLSVEGANGVKRLAERYVRERPEPRRRLNPIILWLVLVVAFVVLFNLVGSDYIIDR